MVKQIESVEEVPIYLDPSIPRCFKGVDVRDDDGVLIAKKYPKFDSSSLPKPEELDLSPQQNLSDPLVYAAVIEGNDNVDLSISPAADALNMAQYVKTQLANE